jgi:hypothetical protein
MKPTKVANYLSWIIVFIFVLLPFHAFLTVSFSKLVGNYTLLRLWKEFLLVATIAGALYLLAKDAALRKRITSSVVARLILLYVLLSVVWDLAAFFMDKVTLKSLGFGLIVNLRFLIFFLVVWIVATKSPLLKTMWPKFLLIPAGVVVLAGLLQRLVLPYDFLKHFGYSSSTIYPYETINHNRNYLRIMSTLRGANPLGAYLILILTSIAALLIKARIRCFVWGIFTAACVLVLIFSYSRSAWIGATLSLLSLVLLSIKNGQIKQILLPTLAVLIVIGGALAWAHHDNPTFENVFFHTQENSTIKTTSDQGHLSAFKGGVHDLVNEPLGRGVGTAGPASVYNHNARISENYFLQIAQETGWAGMILFITINYLVACELWLRREDILARILLASFAGLTIVNLLSHAWTDDTIAYIWWGLAGLAISLHYPAGKRDSPHR